MDSMVDVDDTTDGARSLTCAASAPNAEAGVAGADISGPVHAEIPLSEDSMLVAQMENDSLPSRYEPALEHENLETSAGAS